MKNVNILSLISNPGLFWQAFGSIVTLISPIRAIVILILKQISDARNLRIAVGWQKKTRNGPPFIPLMLKWHLDEYFEKNGDTTFEG